MREVAWVIFDEIHYMRDSGTLCCVAVPWSGLKEGPGAFIPEVPPGGKHVQTRGGAERAPILSRLPCPVCFIWPVFWVLERFALVLPVTGVLVS